MTARPGYIRSRTRRERTIDRAWTALRIASAKGLYLSTGELSQAAGASRSEIKRLTQAARDAGWIDFIREDLGGAIERHLFRLTVGAPERAPVLRLAESHCMSAIQVSATSGVALRRLRLDRGWSLAETGRQLGVADTRTVRRYESAAHLPPTIAERVAALEREKSCHLPNLA